MDDIVPDTEGKQSTESFHDEEIPPKKDTVNDQQIFDSLSENENRETSVIFYIKHRISSPTLDDQPIDDYIENAKKSALDEQCAVDKLCRLCCTSDDVQNDIFDPEDDLQSKFIYIQIQVRRGDGLPRRVCGACRGRVLLWHRFCSDAQRAQHRLRDMVGGKAEPLQDPTEQDPTAWQYPTEQDPTAWQYPTGQDPTAWQGPTDRQDRGTQTVCLPDDGLHDAPSLLGRPDLDTDFILMNVKQELHEEAMEPCDADSDDNTPLVAINKSTSNSGRPPGLSYLQELKRQRPELQIKVKTEHLDDPWPSVFQVPIIKADPDEAAPEPKRKRGRPRKNPTDSPPPPKRKPVRTKKKPTAPREPKKPKIRVKFDDELTIKMVKKSEEGRPNGLPFESCNIKVSPVEKNDEDSDGGVDAWEQLKSEPGHNNKWNKNVFTCCVCSKTLKSHKSCLEHYSTHETAGDPPPPPAPPPPPTGHCERCSKPLEADAWPDHWRRHWQRDQPLHRCTLCEGVSQFRKMADLVQHGLTQHAKEVGSHSTARYMCDLCPTKFIHMRTLLHHRMLQHGDSGTPKVRCARCSFVSKAIMAVRHHVKRKHESNPHLCPHCGKTFMEAHHLKRHLVLHSGEKPYKCRFCGKGFAAAHYLPDHERTHTGEKPHACSFCGRGFSQRSSRMTHERSVHSLERPYVCQMCGRGFAARGFLTAHLKTCLKE